MANGFDKLFQKMFKSPEALQSTIGELKDLKEPLLNMKQIIERNNLIELSDFLEKNCLQLGLPNIQMSKKLEKNFYHAQKFFIFEKIDSSENWQENLSCLVSLALLDKGICLVPLNSKLDAQSNLKRTMEIYLLKQSEIAPAISGTIVKLHELV